MRVILIDGMNRTKKHDHIYKQSSAEIGVPDRNNQNSISWGGHTHIVINKRLQTLKTWLRESTHNEGHGQQINKMWHYLRPDGSVIRAWRLGCSITGRASTMSFELLLHSWVQCSILHGIWQHIKVSSLIQTWRTSAFILGRVSVVLWSRASAMFTTCRKYTITFTMAFANGLHLHKKKQMHHGGSKNHRKPSNTDSDELDWKQRILLVPVLMEQIIWPKKTLHHSVTDYRDNFPSFV